MINETSAIRLENFDNLHVLGKIGSGSFSTVYKAKDAKTGKLYALKKIPLSELSLSQQRKALKEALTQEKVNHPNVIKCVASVLEGCALNLIMEFAPGGDLLTVYFTASHILVH